MALELRFRPDGSLVGSVQMQHGTRAINSGVEGRWWVDSAGVQRIALSQTGDGASWSWAGRYHKGSMAGKVLSGGAEHGTFRVNPP
jgi:hypothetical protein